MKVVVIKRTANIDNVRRTFRRINRIVVPALASAVILDLRGRHVRERGRAGGVIRSKETGGRCAGISIADVHPGVAVGQRVDIKLSPIIAAGWIERRPDVGPGRAIVSRAPDATRKLVHVEDARMGRVLLYSGRATSSSYSHNRPDKGAGGAVAAIKAAGRKRMSGSSTRRCAARHGTHAADGAGDRNEQVPGVVKIHDADGALKEDVGSRNQRPGLAAVRCLVDTDSRFRIARSIRFAGAGIERVARSVVRIHEERADGIDAETARDESPSRVAGERLVGPPNTTARGGDVEDAF